ncbi:HK97 gp10 family phage protein [Paenibacillus sp. MMS18-CY102]|uniref:HK97 gp10 family phage protein n=1 Tax=Paenibacillus sp. MMS18-CY102 TaxID=2682849 RepID=UPI0019220A31
MSRDDFDLRQLDAFSGRLMELAQRRMPKETRKFIMKSGNKLRKLTAAKARQLTKKKTGNYRKGIKRGKVYKYRNEETAIRVYDASPHAHLLEYGHRQVTKSGREVSFVRGYRVFEQARRAFEQEFIEDCEAFIDEMIEEGLR